MFAATAVLASTTWVVSAGEGSARLVAGPVAVVVARSLAVAAAPEGLVVEPAYWPHSMS